MDKYKLEFTVACELLNGAVIYGVDKDKVYEIMMERDGVVTGASYMEFIADNIDYLIRGGDAKKCYWKDGKFVYGGMNYWEQ